MDEQTIISQRYLHVTNIPVWQSENGSLEVPSLWHKDLREHVAYLPDFQLAAPMAANASKEAVQSLATLPMKVVVLPAQRSMARASLALPRTIYRLWKAIGQAQIVHCGIAGWPMPLGWLAAPIARLRRKTLIIIVESAPWRSAVTRKEKIRRAIFERMARWCVGMANISFFTQQEYRDSLLLRRRERGHIIHASWIDTAIVLTKEQAAAAWRDKPANLRLLFAGRLTQAKGIDILLQSMAELSQRGSTISLDILGAGPLLNDCEHAAKATGSNITVRLLGTQPYDGRFFELMRGYHAVIVPSIGDEQPRIVYDAYSQAVPVIASDTAGLRDCIQHKITGQLVKAGDVHALTQALHDASRDHESLKRMGMAALEVARAMTHQMMHQRRAKLIQEAISAHPMWS